MTKQTKTLAALAAAIVVCGGAYAALRVWNDQQAQVDDAVYVTQLSDLTALSLTNGQGELSFTKAEDVWQYDGDASFPAGQEAVEDLAEQIGSLAAIRVIDDPEDLSAYGLDEPALQASVTAGDGTAVTLLLGDVSDSYCYAKRTDSDTVYTISADLSENLESLELLDLAAIPGFPDLGTDTISSLTWESGGTTLTLTKTETETAGAESGDSSSSESAEETEPAWDVNGTAIPSDNSAFTSLMAQLSSLAFDACYDYKGEADTLAACSLDTPVGGAHRHLRRGRDPHPHHRSPGRRRGFLLRPALGRPGGVPAVRRLGGLPYLPLRPGAHRGGGGRDGDGLGRQLQQYLLTDKAPAYGREPPFVSVKSGLKNRRKKFSPSVYKNRHITRPVRHIVVCMPALCRRMNF